MNNELQPIFCDLTVFPTGDRAQMAAGVPTMFRAVQNGQELPDGYAFQFPNKPGMFMELANFVELERQCCPFYHFSLEVEPNSSAFWLKMTGHEGVKEFMQIVWADLQGAAANDLMKTGPGHDLDEVIAQSTPIMAALLEKATPPSSTVSLTDI